MAAVVASSSALTGSVAPTSTRCKLRRFPVLAASVASFPFFLLGYEVSVLFGQIMIQNSLPNNIGYFEAAMKLFLLGGTGFAALLMNYIGRKSTFVVATVSYAVGVVIFVLSFGNYPAYKLGRALMGLGIGIGLVFSPIYIAEISPAHYRGFLGMLPQLFHCLGTGLGYAIAYGAWTSDVDSKHAWRMMMILPGTLSIAITPFVIFWLPKSPCFMVVYGQMASATELFRNKLRVPEAEAEERIRQLRVVANISPMVENVNTRTIIRPRSGGIDRMWSQFRDSVDMVLFVAFLHILRVMSGEYFVATHLDVILALYGYQSMATILKAKLIITAARLGSSLIPLALVDCCGRRALLVISMSVTAIATGVVGVSTFLNEGGMIGDRAIFLLTVGGSLAIEIGMGLGLGGIPWLFGPEAFQLPSRVLGVGAGVICGEILGSVVDLRGVSIFESRKTAARLMLLSTLLLSVGAVSCFLCINKPTARRILTDAETEPPSPPEEQPDVARA